MLDEWVLFPLVILIRSAACFASSCGAASTTLLVLWLSYLWAVCLHASLWLISSSLGRAVKLLWALLICTPVTWKNRCYTWQ
jgi:hypothetical protein